MSAHVVTNPRDRIRRYLKELFELMGTPLPLEWPEVPKQAYVQLRDQLFRQIERELSFVHGQSHLHKHQKIYARFFTETTRSLFEMDWNQPYPIHEASEETMVRLAERPGAVGPEFDQLYCTPDSTQRRTEVLLQSHDPAHSRVFFLGDDDLGSVLLAPHFEGEEGEVHVLDIDDRILAHVKARVPSVHCHKIDLVKGLIPESLAASFDAVVLDPPWDRYECLMFLDKAICFLNNSPSARIYLSFCPIQMELYRNGMAHFFRHLAKRGMTLDSVTPVFNLYSLDEQDTPSFRQELDEALPALDAPVFQHMRGVPYAYSNLYVIRRTLESQIRWWREALFRYKHIGG